MFECLHGTVVLNGEFMMSDRFGRVIQQGHGTADHWETPSRDRVMIRRMLYTSFLAQVASYNVLQRCIQDMFCVVLRAVVLLYKIQFLSLFLLLAPRPNG